MGKLTRAALAALAADRWIGAALALAVRVFIHVYFYVMAAAFVVVSLVMVARGVAAAKLITVVDVVATPGRSCPRSGRPTWRRRPWRRSGR